MIQISLEKKIRKLYNQNKSIECDAYSLRQFQKDTREDIQIMVNGQWLTYQPKSTGQVRKVKYYRHYKMMNEEK